MAGNDKNQQEGTNAYYLSQVPASEGSLLAQGLNPEQAKARALGERMKAAVKSATEREARPTDLIGVPCFQCVKRKVYLLIKRGDSIPKALCCGFCAQAFKDEHAKDIMEEEVPKAITEPVTVPEKEKAEGEEKDVK